MNIRTLALALIFAAGCSRAAQVRPDPVPVATAQPAEATPTPAPVEQEAPVAELDLEPAPEPTKEFSPVAPPVVRFDFDSTVLSESEREKLAVWATFVRESGMPLSSLSITIEGHADERGTEEYNLVLGDKRASAVRTYLGRMGLNLSNVRTLSYGESRPVLHERSEEGFSANRRAEVKMDSEASLLRTGSSIAGR